MTIERERGTSTRPEYGRPVVLPGFAGATLVGQVTRGSPRPGVPAAMPPRRSTTWLLATVCVLATVFLGLSLYIVMSPLPPEVVANAATDAKLATPPTPAPTIPLGSQSMWARDPVEPSTSTTPMPVPEPRTPGVPRSPRVHRPPPIGGPATPPPVARSGDVPIECVLDPLLPKCAAAKTVKPPANGPAKGDEDLPKILGQSELRAGVAPVKPLAKACGAKHGAKPGEKVRVKLSVAGPTGKVIATSPEPPHQGTPLGNCAAAALKKATFSRFQKPVIGLVYSITM